MRFELAHDDYSAPPVSRGRPIANRLLAALPDAELAAVMATVEEVPLVARRILQEANAALANLYFISDGLVSLTMTVGHGDDVETAIVGAEGAVGAPLVLGNASPPWRATVQVAGRAWRMPYSHLKAVMDMHPTFASLLHRYVASCLYETAQNVACASRHTIAQRLARWLLNCQDRLGQAVIPCTHDALSQALGVRRAGVTVRLGHMETQGLIRQHRGALVIADRARLEAQSCGCHRLARLHRERVTG